jgi:hypothetical protein
MSVLDAKTTFRNLKKKGFKDSNKDHKHMDFVYNGKLVLHTKLSHNNQDIEDYLIKQMSIQCQLDKSEFIDLAKCPLSKKEYIELLNKKGLLE